MDQTHTIQVIATVSITITDLRLRVKLRQGTALLALAAR